MSSRKWQKGEGKAGCIFWLLLLGIGVFTAWQMVPPKIADMQLKDYVEELAQLEPRKSGEWFEQAILNRAKDLEIPLKKNDLKVDKTLRRVKVEMTYIVPIDFIVTTYKWKFEHKLERDIFLM